MTKGIDLLKGSLFKNIFFFSLPLILSNLLQVFFTMADSAIVGLFSGPSALGSVGSASTLVMLFTGLLIGMGSGVNVLVGKYIGQNNKHRLDQMVHTGFIVSLIFGVLVMICGIFITRPLLELLNTKEELIDGSVRYLLIYMCGMPGLALYNYGNGVYSAMGETKRPVIYLSIAGVINIGLNFLFVVGLKMDCAGVAVGSICAHYTAASLLMISLSKSKSVCSLHANKLKINKSLAVELLKIGIPSGIQYALFSVANLFLQSAVNSFDAVIVEGNAAAANADHLLYDVMTAFYVACASFMSQNYGANNKKRVLNSYFVCLIYSFGLGLLLSLLLIIFGKQFLSLFTTDQAVIEAGMRRIKIMSIAYSLSAFMDCAIAASRGLGKTIVPTALVFCGSGIFRIVWIYTVFAYYKTFESLFILYFFSYIITGILETSYFIYVYKGAFKKHEINT